MTEFAINFLEQNTEGFFLMIEGGRIDHACHNNDIERMIFEVLEFDKSVSIAENWAADRKDSLIIVTADHETGGLSIVQNNGKGEIPEVSRTTNGHTLTDVNVYVTGLYDHSLKL